MPDAAAKQTTTTIKKLMDGKLRLERRNVNPMIYARTYIQGKNLVIRTGEEHLTEASAVASDWYLGLLGKSNRGERIHGVLFSVVAEKFLKHADQVKAVSEGQRRNYRQKWQLLSRYFEGVRVTDIDARFLLELRQKRSQATTMHGTLVKPATLKKDLVFIRLVLQYAKEWEKCLEELPQFPSFRGDAWAIVPAPRPFLSHEEWTKVRNLAKARAEEPELNPRTQRQRQELYWFLLICVGAALRVGEAYSLRWKDCEVLTLDDADETEVVHMRVLGKHSRGDQREDAYGFYGAVSAFKSMKAARPDRKPQDALFLENHREGMKELLIAANLRVNKDGRTRDAKSLRQTGISMRLDLGPANPDYRDIAKWARTSPAMIATFYDQTHPKDSVGRIAGFRKTDKKQTGKAKRQQGKKRTSTPKRSARSKAAVRPIPRS